MSIALITRALPEVRLRQICARCFRTSLRSPKKDDGPLKSDQIDVPKPETAAPKRKKTMKEIDEEIRAAMEGRSGDGGISGAELEGGKAVAMKRGVRDNMFRYI